MFSAKPGPFYSNSESLFIFITLNSHTNILMNLCTLQHEDASVEMFDHLMKSNEDLQWMMRACGLTLPKDLVFIKEMIQPPAAQEEVSHAI